MQFQSHANDLDIIDDITFWTKAGTTRYPLNDRTRNANLALDRVCALILEADGKWKWDDTNHTDQPIGKTDIVANQADYGISGASFLKLSAVQYLQSDGTYETLDPVDEHSLEGKALLEKQTSGTPTKYVKRGDSIWLGPYPTSALTNGLRVLFQRDVSYFLTTDTTKEPGFAQPFHRLISLWPSLDFCEANGMHARAATIRARIQAMESALVMFYANRGQDERIKIGLKQEDYGAGHLKRKGATGGGTSNTITW